MEEIKIQPFVKTDGLDKTTYKFNVLSSEKKGLPDKKRYYIVLRFDPYDKLIEMSCDCQDFIFNKKSESPCKHINACISCLKEWGEINGF